jgi:hypothetical protein
LQLSYQTNPTNRAGGSLDLLILKTLSLLHGWGINQRVQQMSSGEVA